MTISDDTYLVLFSFCKVVQGAEKSILCDLQKSKIKFIPHEMGAVIAMLQEQPYTTVQKQFVDDEEIFDSYVLFLIQEGFAFYTPFREGFVPIAATWSSPEIINNAIIEYDFANYSMTNVLQQLEALLTRFIEFRLVRFTEEDLAAFEEILQYCSQSVVRSIRVYLPFVSKALSQKIIERCRAYPIIECLIFYQSKAHKSIEKEGQQLYFIPQTLQEITHANIDEKFLVNTLEYYYECQQHNPYYNKKMAITASGDLKNCIKNRAVFGNLHTHAIAEVVAREDFREFWYVTHDQIVEIQDSELRYHRIITNDLQKTEDGRYTIVI